MVHELVKNFIEERIQFCSIIERVDTKDWAIVDIVKFEAPLKMLRAIKRDIDTVDVISIDNRKWLVNFAGDCLDLIKSQQKSLGEFLPEKPNELERHREMQAKLINDEQMLKAVIIYI